MYNFEPYTIEDMIYITEQLQYFNVSTLSLKDIYNNIVRLTTKYNCDKSLKWNDAFSKFKFITNKN